MTRHVSAFTFSAAKNIFFSCNVHEFAVFLFVVEISSDK